MQKMRRSYKRTILSFAMIGVVLITTALAFLTATSAPKVNRFTVGNIGIKVVEEHWNPTVDLNGDGINDIVPDVLPQEPIPKDPKISNIGTNPAYVYISVSVPKRAVTYMTHSNQIETPQTPVELFELSSSPNSFVTEPNEHWIYMFSDLSDSNYNTYYYYYDQILDVGDETTPLFDQVSMIDVIDDQLSAMNLDIQVTGYGIQTRQISGGPAQGWTIIANHYHLPSA